MLFIFSRISVPAMQMSQMLQLRRHRSCARGVSSTGT
jgi:hypothetical protein